jgi:hypothetical protein
MRYLLIALTLIAVTSPAFAGGRGGGEPGFPVRSQHAMSPLLQPGQRMLAQMEVEE